MDEQRPDLTDAPSDGAGPVPAPTTPALASRWQRLRGLTGVGVALVLAFVWGGLAYRGLGPKTADSMAALIDGGGGRPAAVLGSEAPASWVSDVATAFCSGDADTIAARIGPPLTGDVGAIREALASRDWNCASFRYLGGGTNAQGAFYVFVMRDDHGSEQWWVFTVVGERIVSIE